MSTNSLIEILSPAHPSLIAVHQTVANCGAGARFAWEEFFHGQLRNKYTRTAYKHAVTQFLDWVEEKGVEIQHITPGLVGGYFDQHSGSVPTKKQHLAAMRAFFDILVNRHIIVLNPASTVRGECYSTVEGKTPEITRDQVRHLISSIDASRPVGIRDKAIIGTLVYTAARAGAIANLQIRDLTWDGTQYSLRFMEKGGKSRQIPVRYDLQIILLEYLSTCRATNIFPSRRQLEFPL